MEQAKENIAIIGIGTAVPPYRIGQADLTERLAEGLAAYPDSVRWARRIFRQCGVENRYTCEPNLLEPAASCRYLSSTLEDDVPAMAERMAIYKRESVPLGRQAAAAALADARTEPSAVTHLIAVSCTGQFLPGMDAALVRELGLSPRVNRIPLTFLGCAAGLKAIRMAEEIVEGNPSAVVLIVCVELCTLHFQPSASREALFGASFFGDGASACIVSAADPERTGCFRLGRGLSVLLPDTEAAMVWELGNYGFDLYLSPDIPKLLGRYIPEELRLLLGEEQPALWAIHPGGKGIVDTVQNLCGLTDSQVGFSRSVLRSFGNLSSATILFVLQAMKRDGGDIGSDHATGGSTASGAGAGTASAIGSGTAGASAVTAGATGGGASTASGVALAFGPGLTAEMMRFTYSNAADR